MRKRLLTGLGIAACLTFTAANLALYHVEAVGGTTPISPPSSAAPMPDPASLLDARSPGEREAGALFQTKVRLGVEFAPVALRPRTVVAPPLPLAPEPLVFTNTPIPLPRMGTVYGGVPPIYYGTPPNCCYTGTPPISPPPPAVPEPSTWIILTLGVGLVGWRMRIGLVKMEV